MGEFTQAKERLAEEQAPLNYEERQRLRREEVLLEFAGTPLAYTHADGTTRTAHGAYAVIAECPPLQDESIDADYLRQVFTAAAMLAERLEQQPKPDDEDPKDPADEPTEETQPTIRNVQPAEPVETKIPTPKPKEPVSPIMAEPEVVRAEQVVMAKSDEPTERSVVGEEVVELVQDPTESEPAVSVEAAEAEPDTQDVSTVAPKQMPIEKISDNQAVQSSSEWGGAAPTEKITAPLAVLVQESFDTPPTNGTVEVLDSTELAGVEVEQHAIVPEVMREERIAQAVHEVIAIIDQQDEGLDDLPIQVVPEQVMARPEAPEVADETMDSDERRSEEPIEFEAPRLPDFAGEREPDDFYETGEEHVPAESNETPEGTLAVNVEGNDIIEHIEALTRIIEAEQEKPDSEMLDEELVFEHDDEIEILEKLKDIEPIANVTDIAEIVALPDEVMSVLQDTGIDVPEQYSLNDSPKLQEGITEVMNKIESLEHAVSEQECHEAVQELRSELVNLLELLGYGDASFKADQLLRRWQYDLESLKLYIASLQKTIASLQSNVAKIHHTSTKPVHWRYGASAVKLVVSIAKSSQDQPFVAAA